MRADRWPMPKTDQVHLNGTTNSATVKLATRRRILTIGDVPAVGRLALAYCLAIRLVDQATALMSCPYSTFCSEGAARPTL